jgi:hypothetical protein
MESLTVAEGNQTTVPALSYYSNTVLGNMNNQDVVTGLLIGLVIGVAMLVLLLGILLTLFLLGTRSASIFSADKHKLSKVTGPGDCSFGPPANAYREEQLSSQPTILHQPPADLLVHPVYRSGYWQGNSPNLTASDIEQIKVPQSLKPGHWGKAQPSYEQPMSTMPPISESNS